MTRDVISFRGNKEEWNNFTTAAKQREKDVWDALRPFILTYARLDSDKVRQCTEAALRDYNAHRTIQHMLETEEVTITDGTFIQIGLKPLIDADFFYKDPPDVNKDPTLPGLGSMIAASERDFLVHQILNNKLISRIQIPFPANLADFLSTEAYKVSTVPIIILPYNFYPNLFNASNYPRLKHTNPVTMDEHIKLFFVPKGPLDGKIIILNFHAGVIRCVKKANPVTDTLEFLQVTIGVEEKNGKIDVTAKTLVRLDWFDITQVKIIELV